MKSAMVLCLMIVTLAVAASPSMAVMTNRGEDRPMVQCPNQLTPHDGRDVGRILYAPSQDDDPAFRAAVAGLTGGMVDYYDARFGTPSLELMNTYECVYTWPDYPYLDPIAFGDNLADFVDNGGQVVLGVFCTFCYMNPLRGRIMTVGYCPVRSPTATITTRSRTTPTTAPRTSTTAPRTSGCFGTTSSRKVPAPSTATKRTAIAHAYRLTSRSSATAAAHTARRRRRLGANHRQRMPVQVLPGMSEPVAFLPADAPTRRLEP
jgi:hypothetical protein